MKKTLIALAALASTAAFAQSTVTLSGGVAAGIGYTSAQGAAAGASGLRSLGAADNNITFAAVEDLGGGLKSSARVNLRFNPATGANTGTSGFAQNVKLGLSGGFGEIAAGRFNTQIDLTRGTFDVFNAAGAASVNGATGVNVFGHAADETTRYNAMVEYVTPVFSGFKGALTYVPKSSLAGATEATTEGMVSYANGPLAAMVGYSMNTGTMLAAPAGNNGTANTKDKDTLSLGASYNLGVAKLAVFHTDVDDAVDSKRTSFHASMPIMGGGVILKAGYQRFKADAAGAAGQAVNTFAFGADYILSKRTKLIGDVWKTTSDNVARDDNNMSYMLGLKTTF